ncbi:DUF2850 domain-containing protein [Photobacterium sanctipauli]|uniref:DUF2850 domain-containing protein n=1 Tax=Photobacterium sanctipauli TaxID=1342794 RepID=A0A2T3NDY0_9GAMM|nr:DUF2850 domain-containing protein [Photobacterium sanctipauli]PSW12588.1 DUF2850 domain-containing protein [Photobacterium sanctipauli]
MAKRKNHLLTALNYPSLIIAGMMTVIAGLGLWFSGKLEQPLLQPKPLPDIYGVWIEQEVAPYVADSFELRPAGVFVGGRQVNTKFKWDGSVLEYRVGDDTYSYYFHADRLVRQQPAHYISSFTRQKLDLRSKSGF